ncbi:putative fungal-specific transcription factor [Xylogone sp. PMI_703]|nr:putative fungal-specific transcription factor [Xylogone sp. PMI_703]
MPPAPEVAQCNRPGPYGDLKGFSCLSCRQRKVKCDRRMPCSNCTKAGNQCNFIPPVRGKRRRMKPPKEGLHAKLKRYERLLKACGVQYEPSESSRFGDTDCESEPTSPADTEMTEDTQSRKTDHNDPYGLNENTPLLITNEGISRYLDSTMWYSLGHDSQKPETDDLHGLADEPDIQESDLPMYSTEENGLLLEDYTQTEDLAELHPPLRILPILQEIFIDRVDPLMKILHLPTFWPSLMGAVQNPRNVSKSLQALIFSFYLATVSFLEEVECFDIFGDQKSFLYMRYRLATRRALVNARFLSTSNIVTLQAYATFMMGVRISYRCDTLFSLSGVAIRLARKMGLHREGSYLGLSPFESEMRRRLWWHLFSVDFRMSDLMSLTPSTDLMFCDTKTPLNVLDEDLSPSMVNPPTERKGITPIVICVMRCEVIDTLRKYIAPLPRNDGWDVFSGSDFTTGKKKSLIHQIEDHLEQKYLRYCDPSNTLHNLASLMARWLICRLKLFAYNPRRYANSGIKIPQVERDIVFETASKLLEYVSMVKGNLTLKKYMWQVHVSYLWNIILHILIETQHRKLGPEVDGVWRLIGSVLFKYPRIFETSTGAVYTALRKWTLEVWDNYIANIRAASLPDPPTPEYIDMMRCCVETSADVTSKLKVRNKSVPSTQIPEGHSEFQSQRLSGNLDDCEPFESHEFSNILSFEANLDEWLQWESLVAGEGSLS